MYEWYVPSGLYSVYTKCVRSLSYQRFAKTHDALEQRFVEDAALEIYERALLRDYHRRSLRPLSLKHHLQHLELRA